MSLLAAAIFGDDAVVEMARFGNGGWLRSARTAAGDDLWNAALDATRAALESCYGTIDDAKRVLWPDGHYAYLDGEKQVSIFSRGGDGGHMTDEQYSAVSLVVLSKTNAR